MIVLSKGMKLEKLVVLMILIIFQVSFGLGWGRVPHQTMTGTALSVLPEWEKNLWRDQIPMIIQEYCLIPDFYLERPDLAGYAILDDYEVTFSDYTYEIKKPYLIRNGHFHLPDKQKPNYRMYEYFFGKVVTSLEEGRLDDAAKFAGVLLHVIEDYSAPSHSIQGDNQFFLFKQFMPPPEKYKYARLHGLIEYGDVAVDISDYVPRLLGVSIPEVAFHLHGRMNDVIVQARGRVVPIIQAIYAGDEDAVTAHNSKPAAEAAKIAADMLHSAFSIAYSRIDPDQEAALKTAPLADLIPLETIYLAWRQPRLFRPIYGGAPTSGIILDKEGNPLPLSLKLDESGKGVERNLITGIAVGTRRSMVPEPCVISFVIPHGVFSRFEATIGLHSSLGEEGGVVFQVKGGEEILYDSGPLTRDDPAREISIPLNQEGELRLITFSSSKEYPDNYPVWGNPRLLK